MDASAAEPADASGSAQSADEISAPRLALDEQVHETECHCKRLLANAEAEIDALREAVDTEIANAREAAAGTIEHDQRTSAQAIKAAHEQAEKEIARAREEAKEELVAIRAEAQRSRADAQQLVDSAIAMQATIADSLQRAQQQLQSPGDTTIAA